MIWEAALAAVPGPPSQRSEINLVYDSQWFKVYIGLMFFLGSGDLGGCPGCCCLTSSYEI